MLISDKTLWDNLGNKCRIEMHQIAANTFELYMHAFNGAVPLRFIGPLNLCMNKSHHWVDARKAEGFKERQPVSRKVA